MLVNPFSLEMFFLINIDNQDQLNFFVTVKFDC